MKNVPGDIDGQVIHHVWAVLDHACVSKGVSINMGNLVQQRDGKTSSEESRKKKEDNNKKISGKKS